MKLWFSSEPLSFHIRSFNIIREFVRNFIEIKAFLLWVELAGSAVCRYAYFYVKKAIHVNFYTVNMSITIRSSSEMFDIVSETIFKIHFYDGLRALFPYYKSTKKIYPH